MISLKSQWFNTLRKLIHIIYMQTESGKHKKNWILTSEVSKQLIRDKIDYNKYPKFDILLYYGKQLFIFT